MIHSRQLSINVIASALQVAVTGGVFVVLYRFVKDQVGIEYFGVWSLVLATMSISSIANLGLASSVVRFVSMYLAREREDRVAYIVQTATLSLGVFLGLVVAALYPVLARAVALPLEAGLIPAALSILPYAMVSFWLGATAAVLHGCIAGYHRVDLRSALLAAGSVTYLILCLVLVPRRGLVGLGQAQVLQAGLLLIASWVVLKRLAPALPLVPYRWHRGVFTEMLGYSVNFQVVSVSALLFEPLTKFLVMYFGGPAAAGYFEFANRMVVQLRALIVTAHGAIVPTIAHVQERQPALLRGIYTKSYRLLLTFVLLTLPLGMALMPLVARLWIGSYETSFILFSNLLLVGWFLNILSGPAYFTFLGIGILRWNVIGHLVIGVLNGGLGFLLGHRYGGTGVVVGFVTALIAGSLIITVAYQRTYGIPLRDLMPRHGLWLGLASLLGLGIATIVQLKTAW